MIRFVMTGTKRRLMEDFLTYEGEPLVGRMELVTWEELADAEALAPGTWVLADLDALGPGGLELARAVRDAARSVGWRVLNDPDRTLTRLDLLRALHREGINDFRAFAVGELRIDADASSDGPAAGVGLDELRYPVFVRGASDHFGPVGDLLGSPEALARELEGAEAAGFPLDDLIVVEFQDTARPDGRHTKFGAYVVGDRVHLQHFMLGRPWMIKHTQSDFTIAVAEEELAFARANPHRADLEGVAGIAGVEYGRIDYAVDPDGRMQVWEINLCPIIGRTRTSPGGFAPDHVQPYRKRTKDHFNPLFVASWEAVDTDPEEARRIPLDLPDDTRERARDELDRGRGAGGLLRLVRAKQYFGKRW